MPRFSKSLVGLFVFATTMAIWVLATRNQTNFERLALPAPEDVADRFLDNAGAVLIYSLTTASRVAVGLVGGLLLGVATGCALAYFTMFRMIFSPILEILRPLPPIALIPFIILWMGLGNGGQYTLIMLTTFMVFAVATHTAVDNVDPKFIRAARSLGARPSTTFRSVVLPAIVPQLEGATRIAAAAAFGVSLAAEYLGAQGGLGFMMRNARVVLQTDSILLAVLIVGALSYATDILIRTIFGWLTEWTKASREGWSAE